MVEGVIDKLSEEESLMRIKVEGCVLISQEGPTISTLCGKKIIYFFVGPLDLKRGWESQI